tara:strand:- start:2944 stop:3441 length:498 start_codon:yes stop_codon:yes gene_type:complete
MKITQKEHKESIEDDKLKAIVLQVSEYYNMPIKLIMSKTRKRHIRDKRQLCHHIAVKLTSLSLASIGYLCGKLDHATVRNSCAIIDALITTDKKFRSDYSKILKQCRTEVSIVNLKEVKSKNKGFRLLRGNILKACRVSDDSQTLKDNIVYILLSKSAGNLSQSL